ncbi:MAG: deoxyhypusine synthase [Candidatus Aenigmatarchaeota archaeon]
MDKKKVKDYNLNKDTSLDELTDQMKDAGGFVAKKVGVAKDIVEEMVSDEESTNFLSFPACIVSTGTRGLLKELVKREYFDAVITTCGTLDHDLARHWEDYYHGKFDADDRALHQEKTYRLGNIFIPQSSYGEVIENNLQPILQEIYEEGETDLAPYELIWEIGKRMNEDSICYWCWKNKIPMFVPGITDGAVGSQIWTFRQDKDFRVDVFKDEDKISEMVFDAKNTSGLLVGGGISKHHLIWWNQFIGGLERAVYITTAVEWDGSLSGARPEEAISWGKIDEKGSLVQVEGDATVLLPLVLSSVL